MIVKPKVRKKNTLVDIPSISLAAHAEYLKSFCLQELFTYHPARAQEMQIGCGHLTLDFSRQRIIPDTLHLFEALVKKEKLSEKINALVCGEIVNTSEQRPALHTALRDPSPTPIWVNGENIKPSIHMTFEKMQRLCETIWQNNITDVLVLGIGGSFWGPQCVCEALQTLPKRLNVHFLADTEQEAFAARVNTLTPERTVVIVISKSFTTPEALCNALRAHTWLGIYAKSHCLAVTAARHEAESLGIESSHILDIWSWVGGRYSVWSAVGLPIALCYGMSVFKAFLAGAHQMDQHLISMPMRMNMPMMAALLTFFNTRFLDAATEAIIPYSFRLNTFIPYVQQLSMESLGKCHDLDGNPVIGTTGPITWGQTGLHAQHTFNQLLHQGRHCIAVDFILPMDKPDLVATCCAQSQALAFGDLHNPLLHARTPGNQPHNLLKIKALSAETLGALMAFYEHKTYLLACLFNINAFDQFGVELAKRLTKECMDV